MIDAVAARCEGQNGRAGKGVQELDFSIIVMIGLGIILVIELFFVINMIVKMKRR